MCEHTFHAHSKPVNCLAVFAGGRIASGSRDGTIQVWDQEKGCSVRVLDEPMREVACLAVLADDSLLSAFDDGTIRVSTYRDGHWESMVIFVADTRISALVYSHKFGVIVAGDNSGCLHFLQILEPSDE
jgi:WD40 repeat protein